jgi:hypothetical protein
MTQEELEAKADELLGDLANLLRRTVKLAALIGEVFLALKMKVGHGLWQKYVKGRFKISEDTAEDYMAAHRMWDKIEPLYGENPGLRLSAALAAVKQLGGPSPQKGDGYQAHDVVSKIETNNPADANFINAIGHAVGLDKLVRDADEPPAEELEIPQMPPEPSRTRMVQMFLTTTTLGPFQDKIEYLGQKYGTANFTDTVVKSIEKLYEIEKTKDAAGESS